MRGVIEHFRAKGYYAVALDSRRKNGMNALGRVLQEACREKIERDRKRGILNRPVRAMVAGIPNVGKSTFINTYAGRACAKTGNRPGVTKGKQWIRLNKNVELLDTPGILWPKFEDQTVGLRLALIGSIRDEILNTEELALELITFLKTRYPGFWRSAMPARRKERRLPCWMRLPWAEAASAREASRIMKRHRRCCWTISAAENWGESRWNFRTILPESMSRPPEVKRRRCRRK